MKKKLFIPAFIDLKRLSKSEKIRSDTIDKIQKNTIKKLSPKTEKKIKNYVRREQYRLSRELGDNRETSAKIRNLSPKTFQKYLNAREILQTNESHAISMLPDIEYNNHLEMRKNGVMRAQAESYRNDTDLSKSTAENTLRIARIIAHNLQEDVNDIIRGMQLSDRTDDDWELYVKLRTKEKWIPQRKNRKGKYEKLGPDTEEMKLWANRDQIGFYD